MKLNVLYGCDDNYAPYTGISMTSLFENNREIEEITVYLAAMGFSEENRKRFSRIAEQYGRGLVFLDYEEAVSKMKQMHCGTWNGSIATWLRFFVLDQIPESVEHLIWIDSDTIVHPGLSQILSDSKSDAPISAVCDSLSFYQRFCLGLQAKEPYFNAGVLVFHLKKWRENHYLRAMMEHLEKNVARYSLNDQDLLNDFFRGKIQKLPPKFNVQGWLLAYSIKDYFSIFSWEKEAYYSKQELEQSVSQPVITHFFRFLGDYPWTRGKNYHPARALYEEWKNKSLWKDHPGAAGKDDLAFKAEKLLYRLLPRRAFLKLFVWYTNKDLPKEPIK